MVVSDIKGVSRDHFDGMQGVPGDSDVVIEAPMIPICIGSFDRDFRWECTEDEVKSIRGIFGQMNLKRISMPSALSSHAAEAGENKDKLNL